jgi:hypothetical protein
MFVFSAMELSQPRKKILLKTVAEHLLGSNPSQITLSAWEKDKDKVHPRTRHEGPEGK